MSDTPTPGLIYLLEQWEYSPTVSALIELADTIERELTEARRQLTAHKEVVGMCEELILELNESGGYLVTTETEVCCSCEANGKRGQVVHDEGCMQPHVDKVLAAITKLKEVGCE